jgi:hypothetical protein
LAQYARKQILANLALMWIRQDKAKISLDQEFVLPAGK